MRINKETLNFLNDLKKNNNREWFKSNKEKFIAASENFTMFVQHLIQDISAFDTSVANINAKDCVFRIYRDTRFSKDKSPYKINFGAHIISGGKNSRRAGYYIYFQPGASYIGGGIHAPDSADITAIRKQISSKGKVFSKVINDLNFACQFTLSGEKLIKVPKGFDESDPMGEYLKYKELLIRHPVSDKEIVSEGFAGYCESIFKATFPFNAFINEKI